MKFGDIFMVLIQRPRNAWVPSCLWCLRLRELYGAAYRGEKPVTPTTELCYVEAFPPFYQTNMAQSSEAQTPVRGRKEERPE